MSKLEAALDAARRGFSVFPIVENTKIARIKNWPNLATQDEQQIRDWWAQYPNDNIGAATNSLIVVDIDPRNGGTETFCALAAIEEFPKTLRNRTRAGGDHIVYAAPDGPVKGGTNKLGKGVDVKARGGCILLPGSEIDGSPYQQANDNPIAKAPQWIVDQCKRAKQKTDNAGKRVVEEDETAFELAEAWMLNHAPHAEFGEIDDTTYKVAARLYDYGLSEHSVLDIMLEWNETHCSPPGDLERLPVVVESAGKNRENSIGSKHPSAPGFEPVEIDESKAPVPNLYTNKGQDTTEPGKRITFTAESFETAASKALQENAEPLIKGILDRGAMSVLYGESNTGKTFVAIDKGFHIATGRPWAGKKTRKGAVVYVAAEGGRGVYKRLAALRKHYPDAKDVPLFTVKYPVDLLHGPEHGRELARVCQEVTASCGYPVELLVIDTLSRAMSGGDENSSTDMGGIVKSFDALREVTGAHLMVIHHSGKDRARGARGHSLLRAATDTEIEIERGKITVTKQRDLDGDFKQSFVLRAVNIGSDSDGHHVASCVVEFVKTGGGEEVAVPPTSDEMLIVQTIAKILQGSGERYFNADTVRESYLELRRSKGTADGAIYSKLQTLQNKKLIEKVSPGQYVISSTLTTLE